MHESSAIQLCDREAFVHTCGQFLQWGQYVLCVLTPYQHGTVSIAVGVV